MQSFHYVSLGRISVWSEMKFVLPCNFINRSSRVNCMQWMQLNGEVKKNNEYNNSVTSDRTRKAEEFRTRDWPRWRGWGWSNLTSAVCVWWMTHTWLWKCGWIRCVVRLLDPGMKLRTSFFWPWLSRKWTKNHGEINIRLWWSMATADDCGWNRHGENFSYQKSLSQEQLLEGATDWMGVRGPRKKQGIAICH